MLALPGGAHLDGGCAGPQERMNTHWRATGVDDTTGTLHEMINHTPVGIEHQQSSEST